MLIFPPEPLTPQDAGDPAARPSSGGGEPRRRRAAFGPERIAPEWWLDDPAWRSGPRDYWRVETEEGVRLWIFRGQGRRDLAAAGSPRGSSHEPPADQSLADGELMPASPAPVKPAAGAAGGGGASAARRLRRRARAAGEAAARVSAQEDLHGGA